MVLSFEMPFALIPLLKFCNSSKKVGPLKESIYVSFLILIYLKLLTSSFA